MTAKPFSISSDPAFLWLGEKHKEALAVLQYGVLDNKGFLLLTGDVGTGKTTLIQALLEGLYQKSVLVASVPDPGLEQMDFYRYIAAAFKFKKEFSSKGDFLIYFGKFLRYAHLKQTKVLLILDEAQRMAPELLEEIRLLSNFENNGEKLLNIFFVGQNEFNDALLDPKNKALRQRITINYNLKPLSKKEVTAYIAHRLGVVGVQDRSIFTDNAVEAVYLATEGYPRRINILCDHALLTGFVKGISTVDERIVRECEKELQIPNEGRLEKEKLRLVKKERRFFKAAAFFLLGFFLILGSGYLYLAGSSDRPTSAGHLLFKKSVKNWKYLVQLLSFEETDASAPEKPVIYHSVPKEKKPLNKPLNPDKVQTSEQAVDLEPKEAQKTDSATQSLIALAKKPPPAFSESIVIHFARNSIDLPEAALMELDRIADALIDYPQKIAEIVGYSDAQGAKTYNLRVSEFRATILRSYLIGKGVEPSRIRSMGKGPENPIASNDTAVGRQQNRRVEIKVKDREGKFKVESALSELK